MQEIVCNFVHSRGGGQDIPARVSSPPPLNVVIGIHGFELKKKKLFCSILLSIKTVGVSSGCDVF